MNRLLLVAAHWPAVRAIYAGGVATGTATFTFGPPTWPTAHRGAPNGMGLGLGWAALSPVLGRGVVPSTAA